ncbi:hypothetical protein [Pedobacter gandavensis]|uniref:FAS1 domain-containing protein n=1 Tax=Pedobacter gandavensis TaxID=2679963 RepID=A0ABR6EXN0_9SPHI|nr:hypothetical protein [Pedobacter gandavensis]MBB2150038.1 hypothetical protein [Pedobacter gandavensis]
MIKRNIQISSKRLAGYGLKVLLAVICCSAIFSCKKNDSPYYDYRNEVQEFDGDILAYLNANRSQYDSMLLVLDRLPALKDSLVNRKLTVFALNNKCFQTAISELNQARALQSKRKLSLQNSDILELDTMMSKYLIRGNYGTERLSPFVDGSYVESINHDYPMHILYKKINASGFEGGGPQVLTFSDPKGSIFVKFWERTQTVAVNIKAKNGVIHILSPGHVFGFNEFVKRINK